MMMIDWVKNRFQRTPSDLPDNFQVTSSFQENLNPLFSGHKHHLKYKRGYQSDFPQYKPNQIEYWIYILTCTKCNETYHIRVTLGFNPTIFKDNTGRIYPRIRVMEWWS